MRVRIEAPSSPFSTDRLVAGLERLRGAGFVVGDALAQTVLRGRHAYLNGTDGERLGSLEDALASDADVIWLARGGYGLTRITSRLRAAARDASHGPLVVGFSDATALFAHLVGSGVRCIHGPLATTLAAEPEDSFAHMIRVIRREARGRTLPVVSDAHDARIDLEGWLFAGNLCVLAHVAGTPSAPCLTGSVLVLEEVGERPYRIDRALTQLAESGMLQGVRAIVVGHLTGCDEPMPPQTTPVPPPGASARDRAPAPLDVFRERAAALGIPLVHGLRVGHETPNFALPLGVRVHLSDRALTILEDLP